MTLVSMFTTTSNSSNILDQAESVSLTVDNMATLPPANIVITADDTEVNSITKYTFQVTVTNPIPIGGRIILILPDTIIPQTSTPGTGGTGKINGNFNAFYNSTTRQVTCTNIISSYVSAGEVITFTFSNVKNPPTTVPITEFTFISFAGIGYNIETNTVVPTFAATAGNILTFTVTPQDSTAKERSFYDFTFVTENPISVGSSLIITFPSEIIPDARTDENCVSVGTNFDTGAQCTVSGVYTLTISGGFPTEEAPSGTTISISVNSILNPSSTAPSSGFLALFSDLNDYPIDQYIASDTVVSVTATTNTFSDTEITPAVSATGVESTYTFQFTTRQGILRGSYLHIIIPEDIFITSMSNSANSCTRITGFTSDISCVIALNADSTYTMVVSGGFDTSVLSAETISLNVNSIRSPRSNAPTLSFKVYVYNNDTTDPTIQYEQYKLESGLSLEVNTISDFTNVSLTRASTLNGVVTDYTFTLTLSNLIKSGDYIRIIFPGEVELQSTTNQ